MMFIPHLASRMPLLGSLLCREIARFEASNGKRIDFSCMHWMPPALPRAVLDQEVAQIHERLGLHPLVSITDHDCIDGVMHLQVLNLSLEIPISMEWSVPYDGALFHLGVHNLPADQAHGLLKEMQRYNAAPSTPRLAEVLSALNSAPQVLLVLNHPLWNLHYDSPDRHARALAAFLRANDIHIHALELNGYRAWSENRDVLSLAEALGKPAISGGDRHGWQPNALLNLTAAPSFSDFAAEIRRDRLSQILILPEYREPRSLRAFITIDEVLRDYPRQPWGHQRWTDRVLVEIDADGHRPLSHFWHNGGPWWLRSVLWAVRAAAHPRLRPVLRRALTEEVIY
ncbi:MAG: hypothetical protein HXY20_05830 [Acidobacteria bacterium]|nr:hypothetical protein [Acidobacteriota bacterium]